MLRSGLVSVTFRQLTPLQIIGAVSQAGLESIEWGGDVHIPHGDQETARLVRSMTEDAGLLTSAYGSYYRVGYEAPGSFETVLETALTLGATTIRVWAGRRGSKDADQAYREMIVLESRRIATLAQASGIVLAYEFHGNTLTDSNRSARDLLEAVGHNNMKIFWQPPNGKSHSYALAGLNAAAPWLANIHIFHWRVRGDDPDSIERLVLSAGESTWRPYLQRLRGIEGDHFVSMEFVRGDSLKQFREDAEILKIWLSQNAG